MELSQPVPRANPSIAWTKLPDGAVLFAPDSEIYYSMNQVGALIWELLPQAALDMDSLCQAVHEAFPGERIEQIRMDVEELLNELVTNGLVTSTEQAAVA
jgi:hypothetical protein